MLHIDRVEVGYTVETEDGPEHKLVTLANMRKHCRAERVDDLLDDLQVLCKDVQDARDAGEAVRLRVIR
jgi:hypothetical protein